jgi:hypothetical protein
MPLKFEIYKDGRRLAAYHPAGAMVLGPESTAMMGEVAWRDGLLNARCDDEHAIGISLLWDLGPLGAFELETTRLPQRAKPYILNVELARSRLMRIVQKQEDWNLFDFPKAEGLAQRVYEAQELLADALGKLDRPAEAAALADQALLMAVDLSEEMADFHADLLLSRRKIAGQFVKHIFGCHIDSSVRNAKYRDAATSAFDYAVLSLPWKQLQPEEHIFDTQAADEWIELLGKKRIPVIAGPLIRLDEHDVPDWMFIWEHDFDTLRELAYEHVARVVQRYRRLVGVWNVCAGLPGNTIFPMSFEQMIEMTRLLVTRVKTILPQARTLVTISKPFGEHQAKNPSTASPLLYAEMVAQAGINFEGFGLELEMGLPKPDMFMRDLFQISCLLDKFSMLNKPVFLTAICCPGRSTPDLTDSTEGRLDPSAAGRWRRPWDPQLQADWMEAVYRLALCKPYIESIAWGNLADINQTLPGGGLLDEMVQPKPVFNRLEAMRDTVKQWTKREGKREEAKRET